MSRNYVILGSLCILLFAGLVIAQSISDSERSWCFQFTWLGPRFHNESNYLNATCSDATRLASGVPCRHPLVASFDGSWPDVEFIWNNHRQQATCVMGPGDVCAQYTYYFNGIAQNSTYMCTRAIDSEGTAIVSGTFRQVNGSFTTEVKFCQSLQGAFPCNNYAVSNNVISLSLITFAIFALIVK